MLTHPKKVVIIPHRNPDGDAVGASLGLYGVLKQLGHQCSLISPNDFPDFLKWMENADQFAFYEDRPESCLPVLQEADLIFTVDFNALDRLGSLGEALKTIQATYIMIDHHQQPDTYARFTYSDTAMSSTCEMVYRFLGFMDLQDLITPGAAEALYTGIMTDTGSFRFPSTSPDTYRIAAALMEKGADHSRIHQEVYDSNSPQKLQLLGTALANMEVLPEYRTAILYLTQEELDKHHFRKGDTEGFVNYGLSLKGIIFSVIFIENVQEGIIKISLRSKGDFSVNDFSRNHYQGGGHINAAGGKSTLSLQETIQSFKALLPQYKNQLAPQS